MDYTVIVGQRNHFGDEQEFLPGIFVGQEKSFSFNCPGVDPAGQAVLMLQALHVTSTVNIFIINNETIFGGLPRTTQDKDAWSAQVLLISPNTLRASNNVLRVKALTESGSASGDIDDFVIDNVVLFYKTR